MAHGSGGASSAELMRDIFSKHFGNETLDRLEDSAVFDTGAGRLAVSTDSFVVTPLVFPGGDIGKLAVCGTVNDVLMSGATPKYLTCGFIIEAGLSIALLDSVCASFSTAAKEAGVTIVAGDTKVIEGRGEGGGLIINTTGIGTFDDPAVDAPTGDCARCAGEAARSVEEAVRGAGEAARSVEEAVRGAGEAARADEVVTRYTEPSRIRPGDAVIISGNLGDHHAAILSARMGIKNSIESDCALLTPITSALRAAGVPVHAMRDVTRGGLGTVLNELATGSDVSITIEEEKIPVSPEVRAFCGLMGLDPLYMGNEGKMVYAVAQEDAQRALAAVRETALGVNAAIIGTAATRVQTTQTQDKKTPMTEKEQRVASGCDENQPASVRDENLPASVCDENQSASVYLVPASPVTNEGKGEDPLCVKAAPPVTMRTRIGGTIRVDVLYGEGLPRIC